MNDTPALPSTSAALELNPLRWRDPLHWLRLGLRDFLRCPGIGLFYGACFVVMG